MLFTNQNALIPIIYSRCSYKIQKWSSSSLSLSLDPGKLWVQSEKGKAHFGCQTNFPQEVKDSFQQGVQNKLTQEGDIR